MLRHACGYKLANDGRDTRALQHYLGHKSIQHTVRYTKLCRIGSAISVATERAAGLVQRPLKENACTAFLGRMRGLYGRHEALCAADFSPKVLEPATVPEGQSYAARSFG